MYPYAKRRNGLLPTTKQEVFWWGGDGDPARNGRGRLVGLRPLDRRLGAVLAVEDRADEAGFFPDCIQQIADQTRDIHIALPCHGAQADDDGVVNLNRHGRPMLAGAAASGCRCHVGAPPIVWLSVRAHFATSIPLPATHKRSLGNEAGASCQADQGLQGHASCKARSARSANSEPLVFSGGCWSMYLITTLTTWPFGVFKGIQNRGLGSLLR
jgi:hypothetical protein